MEILRRAPNTTLSFQGQSFSIYQDYSPTVSRERTAFGQAKRLLQDHPGVKYELLFPDVYGFLMMVKTTQTISLELAHKSATVACELSIVSSLPVI